MVVGAALALAVLAPPAAAQDLTVQRIAALPSLIGTAPTRPVWSPDSSRLAFLWNDEAMPFRDIRVVAAEGGEPQRITYMAETSHAPGGPGPEPGSLEALQQEFAERSRRGVSEVVWTPDGQALVFAYRGHLFRVGADGGEVKRLTREAGGRHGLAFSPDGSFLSFLQGGDLYLWHQKTRELVKATDVGVPPIGHLPDASFYAPDSAFMAYRWSPDSRHIALRYEDRRNVRKMLFPDYLGEETHFETLRRDLPGENDLVRTMVVYSLASGRTRTVDFPDPTDRRFGSFGFSPDGSRLLVDQFSEEGEDRWIYIVDAEEGSVRELRHDRKARGGNTTSASSLWTSVWSSDGDAVILISDIDGWFRLYSMPIAGGPTKKLTSGDWSVTGVASEGASLTVSPKTKEVFFIASKKSLYERPVYRMSEGGGVVTQVTTLPGSHLPFVSPDGKRVATLRSSAVSPAELYVVAISAGSAGQGGSERRVTHSPPEEFAKYSWIEPRYVTFRSRADGATLHGRLLEPPNLDRSKRHAAVLGPVYSNTVRDRWSTLFDTFQQYLALERGYLVLLVDIRGSVGYGREFRSQFVENVGEIDIEDLHSGVEYLEMLPYVDPDRIGIWGWSYGGLLAAMSLFKKPGVYQAGVAGAPATNVWHATTGEVDLFFHPNARPDLYRKGSAFRYADRLQDPLMIIQGMQDTIVLFRDSIYLAEKLMLLGKDFEIVPLPSSVHNARNKDYVATHVLKKIDQHFEHHLGSGPTRSEPGTQ